MLDRFFGLTKFNYLKLNFGALKIASCILFKLYKYLILRRYRPIDYNDIGRAAIDNIIYALEGERNTIEPVTYALNLEGRLV